jgi:hypothetical protein
MMPPQRFGQDHRMRMSGRAVVAVTLLLSLVLALSPTAGARPVPQAPDCPLFPRSNPWNQRIDDAPVARGSRALLRAMGLSRLHADFSDSDRDGYGIPFQVVDGDTPRHRVTFDYADESDPGPYPIPRRPLIEGGADRHLITIDRDTCVLRELFAARRAADGTWHAGSGAVFDLTSNRLRPAGWTSADAAGLPILPGLARHDEVAAGRIDHALRFTLPVTQRAYTWPARHFASARTAPRLPPMGLRLRLKSSFDISNFGPQTQVILTAAKRYGLILADNGSAGYITGAPAPGWDDDDLHDLHDVPGSAFEVVDPSALPGAHGPRLWNRRIRVVDGQVRAAAFLTAAATVRLEAVRDGRVVAARRVASRHGLLRIRMPAESGARYRLRLV